MPDEDSPHPDSLLVRRALAGAEEDFTRLFQRYYTRVRAFAFRVVLDHQGSDDVAQETFIRAARKLATLDEGQAFESWIFRIASNVARDHLRSRRAGDRKVAAAALVPPSEPDEGITDEAQRALGAMEALPAKQREAVALVYFEDLSHGEAALRLDCAESTISWRIFLAKRTLKKMLARP